MINSGSSRSTHRQSRRNARDLKKLPRSPGLSYLYRAAEAAAAPNHPPIGMYTPASLWEWMRRYMAYVFNKKHFFPPHSASPQNAMYNMLDETGREDVRLSVAGDWGTGTDEAESVAKEIKQFKPHFTIHIGDVYYVGDLTEINENCLGIKNPNNNYDPVIWPVGSLGSFALNGNHEMYANGNGYFELLLPRLGIRDETGQPQGQQTSFFCLENSYWRVIAIDTGYNSIGVPVLSHIPLINNIPGIGGNCELRQELTKWLSEVIAPSNDKRGLIIMSHHQPYSGFEKEYHKPAQQLWDCGIRRSVLWFWGHEHRLAGYGLYGTNELKSFGRCVGHGGMPVSRGDPVHDPHPLFYDNRTTTTGYGVNGHVNLSFSGPKLMTTYIDLNGKQLFQEEWSVGQDGAVQLVSKMKLINDPDFHG